MCRKNEITCKIDHDIDYYIEFFKTNRTIGDIMCFSKSKNEIASQIVFKITFPKGEEQINKIFIHNFETFPKFRNRGIGSQLLEYTRKKIKEINKGICCHTISIAGALTPDDHDYWKYSLPMYYKLSKGLMGHNLYCFVNNTKSKSNKIVSMAEKLYIEKTPVNFKFAKK